MGKHPGKFKLRIDFFSIFFFFFLFSVKMNLTVFAGILLAVTMATARRASLGEKIMQAAGEADEPEEAMREAARPVEKMMNKRTKQAVRAEKKKQAADVQCFAWGANCESAFDCCSGICKTVNNGKQCGGSSR